MFAKKFVAGLGFGAGTSVAFSLVQIIRSSIESKIYMSCGRDDEEIVCSRGWSIQAKQTDNARALEESPKRERARRAY